MPSSLVAFTKMQALGNDFIVIEADALWAALGKCAASFGRSQLELLTRSLCHRQFGIGADGLVVFFKQALLQASKGMASFLAQYPQVESCDVGWIYVNSDGSHSNTCGNALRCLAVWAKKRGFVAPPKFTVAAAHSPVVVTFENDDLVTIDMGVPILERQSIPLSKPGSESYIQQPISLSVDGKESSLSISCVSMGNPHCVIFSQQYQECKHGDAQLERVAQALQKNALFPEGANIEFVSTKGKDYARVLVWERGCGPTLACASGAAATLVAGVLEGKLDRKAQIELPGGILDVTWCEEGQVEITGPAKEIYSGEIDLLQFEELRASLAAEALCS